MQRILGLLKSPAFVAWVAIVVSVGQAVVNLPLLKGYYFVPELVISPLERDMHVQSAGSFQMINSGSDVARDIEIGLELPSGGYVQLMPSYEHELQCEDRVIKVCRLKIARLPVEKVLRVIVIRGKRGTEEQEKHMEILDSIGISIPRIEYAIFGDGQLAVFRGGQMNKLDVLGKVQR